MGLISCWQARRNQDNGLPAAEEGHGAFEMTGLTSADQNGDSMSSFYREVRLFLCPCAEIAHFTYSSEKVTSIQGAIKQYESNVSEIADLQNRSLNVLDQKSSREYQAQLDDLVAETRSLGNSLKEQIRALASWPVKGRDGAMIRKSQVSPFISLALYIGR